MSRSVLPRTSTALVAGTMAITLVAMLSQRAPLLDLAWSGLLGLVLIASLLYDRPVYISLLLILVTMKMWVQQETLIQPELLARHHAGPAVLVAVLSEIVYRLNADRRREEAVFWKSEERFRAIFESSGMGISVLDRNGRFTLANRALQQMLGRPRGEILGAAFVESMHPEDAALHRALYADLIHGESDYYQRESRYTRPDGELVWCRVSVSLVRNASDQPEYAVAMLEDITVSRRSEEALRESERRYRSVVDNIKEVIFQADPAGRLTFINPAWTDITGREVEESLGAALEAFVHPDDRGHYREMVGAVLEGRVPFQRYTVRVLHREGGFRWVEVFFQAYAEGGSRLASGTLNDITEQKREEEERQRLAEQRSNMIATVSHELRAPIAAMMLNFDLLADGTLGDLTEEQQEYVRGATTSILDLAKTVDDLLAVSRLHDGRVKLRLEAVDLHSLLSGVQERMSVRARASGVVLRMEVDPDLPTIESDRQQLAHILTELIENGIKYSRGQGVVTVTAREEGERILLQVADMGPGISPEEREHIFEPFYRSSAAMREQIPGTGLGLHIVNQITLLVGAELQVRNGRRGGAIFRLMAPRKFQRMPTAPA